MSTLIQRLNEAYARNPDPDAIQKAVWPSTWIRCNSITPEFFEAEKNNDWVVKNFEVSGLHVFHGVKHNWRFTHCAATAQDFVRALHQDTWWMIPLKDYEEGSIP